MLSGEHPITASKNMCKIKEVYQIESQNSEDKNETERKPIV
jgi:hypothetical protein